MSDVQLEDQADEFGRPPSRSSVDFTGKLISWGIVSDRKQAEYVVVGLAVVVAIIAFFVYRSSG